MHKVCDAVWIWCALSAIRSATRVAPNAENRWLRCCVVFDTSFQSCQLLSTFFKILSTFVNFKSWHAKICQSTFGFVNLSVNFCQLLKLTRQILSVNFFLSIFCQLLSIFHVRKLTVVNFLKVDKKLTDLSTFFFSTQKQPRSATLSLAIPNQLFTVVNF